MSQQALGLVPALRSEWIAGPGAWSHDPDLPTPTSSSPVHLSNPGPGDYLEGIQPQDLMKNATIMASYVWHAAIAEERIPRKARPAPVAPPAP